MVITPQAFTESRNGRQQTTDGLWVHRGRQQLRLNPPAINALSHVEAPLEIRTDRLGTPMLSFHEADYSASTLYKPPQGQGLRVRQTDGQDYPLVGATGSVTGGMIADGSIGTADLASNAATKVTPLQSAPAGSTTSVSAVAAPSPFNNIVVSGHTGGLTIIHGSLQLYHSVVNGQANIQIGVNGGGVILAYTGFAPVVNNTFTAPIHAWSAAGVTVTSVQVYWYTNTGTLSWSTGVYSFLFITEYKK